MLKKTIKRAAALLSASVLCFGAVSCAETENGKRSVEVDIWAATGAEKILRDTDYSAKYDNKTLKISVFRNEHEAGQIVITPSEATEYEIALSDLKTADGNVLSKESFSVYHEKYLQVAAKDQGATTGSGYYPDALIPYANAVEYDENKIGAGRNQAIWVDVKPSKEQEAGTYRGNFTVTCGGESHQMPVEVVVYDYTLSDGTHSKSQFGQYKYQIQYAELDASLEMAEAYYEFLLDHKISSSEIPYPVQGSVMDMDFYVQEVAKYIDNPNLSVYRLPVVVDSMTTRVYLDRAGNVVLITDTQDTPLFGRNEAGEWITDKTGYTADKSQFVKVKDSAGEIKKDANGNPLYISSSYSNRNVNEGEFRRVVMALVEYSLEHDVNLLSKAITSMTVFDEYDSRSAFDAELYAITCLSTLARMNETLSEEILAIQTDNTEMREQLAYNMKYMQHRLIGEGLSDNILNLTKSMFTATIDRFGTERTDLWEYAIDGYGEEEAEVWCYTCVNPQAPWSTYHIEDQLVSARLLNWMMYDYDLSGNLFWASVLYGYTEEGMRMVQDYYGEPLRYPMNGDGYVLYPGRPYGVYGPLSSIRLEAIRDGNDDYDLMYELEEFYKQRDAVPAFDKMFELMSTGLYNGTRVNYDGVNVVDTLYRGREMLADLLEMASNAGVVVEKYEKSGNQLTLWVSADSDTAVKINGNYAQGEADGALKLIKQTITLGENDSAVKIEATKNGKTYSLTLNAGKAETYVESYELKSIMSGNKCEVSTSVSNVEADKVVDADIIDSENGKPSLQLDMSGYGVDGNYKTVKLRIYNYGDTVQLTTLANCERVAAFLSMGTMELKNGWNEVEIDLSLFNFTKYGNLSNIRFNFETADGELLFEEVAVAFREMILVR